MKLMGASKWYKYRQSQDLDDDDLVKLDRPRKGKGKGNTRDNRHIEAFIFVPHTPGGTLKASLNSMEARLGFRTRVKYEEELAKQSAVKSSGKTHHQHIVAEPGASHVGQSQGCV